MLKKNCLALLTGTILCAMSFSVSFAQTCNYNGICESGEETNSCVYDCLISTSHKDIKIQNATYNVTKAIHYKLDGSKEEIIDVTRVKDFLINNIDFSVLGVIGAHGEYRIHDLTDDIPVIGYRSSGHCVPSYITAAEYQEYNQHEEWFAHQSGEIPSQRNRLYRKYFDYDAYLYNPTSQWIERYTDFTKLYLDNQPGYDGVFLDDNGWLNTLLYAWHKIDPEVKIMQEFSGIGENGNPFSVKYLDTDEPIYSDSNFPAIVSSLTDPSLSYDNIGIWGEIHRIYFDYSIPVAAGTAVNVSYYTDATIPQVIQDTWTQQMLEVLSKTREKIGGNLIIYNGFSLSRDYDNDFLQIADGGMYEGLFHNGWTPLQENLSESYWKQHVDKLFDISHNKKKVFLAQTNAIIDENTTEAQFQKLAMYYFASFLLGKGDYAYYGFNVFPGYGGSDQFIYFDYWKTDIGKALENYHLRETTGGANIYEREFEKALVLVNPSESNATINLGKSYQTLTGGVVSSVALDSKSGVILHKFGVLTTTTTTSVRPTTTTTSVVPTTTTTSVRPTTTTTSVKPATTTTTAQPVTTTTSVMPTTTTTMVQSTTTTKPVTTSSTTTSVTACMTDANCDDGLYCNGIEQCDNGNCIPGAKPCQTNQVCNESRDQCRDVKTKPGRINPAIISRPVYKNEKTTWTIIKTNEDNYFDGKKSKILFARSGSNAEGIRVDSVKKAFKIQTLMGSFIFLPVRLHKQTMVGDWELIINTEVDGLAPFEENIVSHIRIK